MAELRVMAWQAMLAGAETLSFFEYNLEIWSQTPGFHDQFVELMQELTSLRDRLRDATIRSWMDAQNVLHAEARWQSGYVEFITVNTNRSSAGHLAPLAVVESPLYRSCPPTCRQVCAPQPIRQSGRCSSPGRVWRTRCNPCRNDD